MLFVPAELDRISPVPISSAEFYRTGHRLVDQVAEFLDCSLHLRSAGSGERDEGDDRKNGGTPQTVQRLP